MKASLRLALLIAVTALLASLGLYGLACMLNQSPELPPARDWGEEIPAEIVSSALDAELVLDEAPCDWRAILAPIFRPAVKDCRSAREATLHIARNLGAVTGVSYSTERSHPSMNAREALEQKKVSCTGNSILLVCALRSVGIPARIVGVASWRHVRGNHTWVEAWFEGEWHMVEANEEDFNTPWVLESIGMLTPQQRVLAVQAGGIIRFPTPWNPQARVAAEDVTVRYQELARQWYARNGVPTDCQKLMVELQPRPLFPRAILLEDEAGRVIDRDFLPTPQDDVRRFASLLCPRGVTCYLRVEGTEKRSPVQAEGPAARVIQLRAIPSFLNQ